MLPQSMQMLICKQSNWYELAQLYLNEYVLVGWVTEIVFGIYSKDGTIMYLFIFWCGTSII